MSYDPRYAKRYRLDVSRGNDRSLVPTEKVRKHIAHLEAEGLSRRGIAETAGVSASVVTNVMQGGREGLQRKTAGAILAVTREAVLERSRPRGFVPNVGARRRIRALLAIGWTHDLISEHANLPAKKTALVLNQAGDWIARSTHDAIVRAYDALSMTPGPSTLNRKRAERVGYAPPLAWDEESIDDPAAAPDGVGDATGAADLDEWLHLVRAGEDGDRAAHRLGVTIAAIARSARRHGRLDIAQRADIARNQTRRAAA